MTMKTASFAPFLMVTAGVALAAAGLSGLRPHSSLRHSHNLMAVQGSAYGKLLARLSETTIDRVWHLGVEQIVPHYMSGKAHGAPEKKEHPVPSVAAKKDLLDQGKQWIQDRVVAQHDRTNPYSLNKSHLATVHRDIEKLLLRSFKLDPTHFGAYDSYHLFLTTSDFGGSPDAIDQARRIAEVAIGAAFHEKEDPEPWLTASAAGMNLFIMESNPYLKKNETIPLPLLEKYRNKIGYCLGKFDEVQGIAEKAGNWDRLSTDRQMEIAERSLFAKRTFKQFDAMIARFENKNGQSPPAGEVAETEAVKEE